TAPSLPFILDLTEREGFPKIYVSHLVFSGRGGSLGAVPRAEHRRLSQMLVDRALEWHDRGQGPDLVTGNNETDAVILLERFRERHPQHAAQMLERLQTWGGNQAGARLVNVDPTGNVRPDPFYTDSVGNLRRLPFEVIWRESELLRQLRQRPINLKGPCSQCAYVSICNGNSRARSHAVTGDYFQSDPSCFLSA
ncbi:MAG: SPASM domain-containing protein, partial [Candidatus Eremiobacterota bacterium]